MIIFHAGNPGSGKSYDAVRKIIDNLRLGRDVYSNIDGLSDPACQEAIKSVSGINDYDLFKHFHPLVKDQVTTFWKFIRPGCLVVIDEAQKYWNSRDWTKQENNELVRWADEHRHYGIDVVFITPRIDKVDAQFRCLAEWVYSYKKINFLGSLVNQSYLVFAYNGEDVDGEPVTKMFRRYERKFFACYKSYFQSDTKELAIQQHANILKHPVFIAIPVVFIFSIVMFFQSGIAQGDFFGYKKYNERTAKQTEKKVENKNVPAGGILTGKVPVYNPSNNQQLKQNISVAKNDAKSLVPTSGAGFRRMPDPHTAEPGKKSISKHKVKHDEINNEYYAEINGEKLYRCGESVCVK